MATDHPILLHKTALMQRIADFVRVGYRYWTGGTVPAERAAALVRKFTRYYRIDLDRNRRARAKKSGEGCAVLLAWPASDGVLAWFLLVTPGDHPAHQLEKLRDALDPQGRITLTGYELVRATRRGAVAPAWTWRMTQSTYADWRLRVIETVRRGDGLTLRQMMASLQRVPGFAGCRVHAKKCLALLRAQWQRTHADITLPTLARLAYVRRVASLSVPLSVWLQQVHRLALAQSQPVAIHHEVMVVSTGNKERINDDDTGSDGGTRRDGAGRDDAARATDPTA